mmetsp:Transcript_7946/g.16530  ORF Transcript_7946/g.16530 Transcript_7946/m.16530 type:complete len:213 (-) Transcript_7946:1678-2316(-)
MRLGRAHFLVSQTGSTRYLGHGHSTGPLGAGIGHLGSVRVTLSDGSVFGTLFLFQIGFGGQHRPQDFSIVLGRAEGVVLLDGLLCGFFTKIRYNLEGITLIDQILLAFGGIKHLLGIRTHQRIEESIEGTLVGTIRSGVGFGSQNTSKPLRFLPTTSKVTRYLNNNIGLGKIDGGVTNLRDAYSSQHIGRPENSKNGLAFFLGCFSIDQWSL